jgi:hypothetical protein
LPQLARLVSLEESVYRAMLEAAGFDALYSPWLTDGNCSTTPTLPGETSASCLQTSP